jgi:hypothetical protein
MPMIDTTKAVSHQSPQIDTLCGCDATSLCRYQYPVVEDTTGSIEIYLRVSRVCAQKREKEEPKTKSKISPSESKKIKKNKKSSHERISYNNNTRTDFINSQ